MNAINKYRAMWLLVMFDLPTETDQDKKAYVLFRKGIMKDGFSMMQYSVYRRHCASRENAEVHVKRVKSMLPPKGLVSIIGITDRQFGDIKHFWGKKRKKSEPQPQQLEMF